MNRPVEPPWVLFCESSPRWSSALRASLVRAGDLGAAARVVSMKQPPEKLFAIDSPLWIAMEVKGENASAAVQLLSQCRSAAMVGAAALASVKSTSRDAVRRQLLEAGATVVLFTPHETPRLATLARRHAARFAAEFYRRESIVEQVRRRLPWQSPPWAIG